MATRSLPVLHWLIRIMQMLAVLAIVASCQTATNDGIAVEQRLENYFAKIDYASQAEAGYLMVPSYGCKGCRDLVLQYLDTLLQQSTLTLFVSRPTPDWPNNPRVQRDTMGWLDRSGLARGEVMYYAKEDGQVTRVDSIAPDPTSLLRILEY